MTGQAALLAVIVFVAFTIHATIGFAGMLSALAFGSLFFDLEEIRPPLVALSVLLNLWVVVRERHVVAWHLLGRLVLPLMAVGTALGFAASGWVDGDWLRRGFGAFVLGVVIAEFRKLRTAGSVDGPTSVSHPWVWVAGVIQGLYASGGPALVYALARQRLDKGTLRATLCAVWVVLNSALSIGFAMRGDLGAQEWTLVLALVPSLVCATLAGVWLHDRLDERQFRVAVTWMLLIAAIVLIFR